MRKRKNFIYALSMIFILLLSTSGLVYASTNTAIDQGTKFTFTNNHPKPCITDKDAVKQRTEKITKGIADTFAKTHDWNEVDN